MGLLTRFTARPGITMDYGVGCAGEGGFVPKNRAVQIPSPGILWTHEVTNAPSGVFAALVIGTSNTLLGGVVPLPTDVNVLFGLPPSGCNLLTDSMILQGAVTVGGGAGSGFGKYDWQLAPVSSYVGVSVFTQWVVFDPLSPNGFATTSQGVHSIVAPVGG
jgi:hypothetical protein